MKTLADHINDSQLTANIVRSEINHGRTVKLVQIEGTERTAVISDEIGVIAIEGTMTWRDSFTAPIDEISSLENLPEFKMVEEEIRTASVYNNCTGKLHIGIYNGTKTGRTMCANLLHTDLKLWINKEASTDQLVQKYFHHEEGVVKYSNPKN